ncbi:MAG TPA: SH3 domain-containing protein [Usitatibacter sp.]|nr:SH3 domain-containing protein [Usitatibacter sp.]
MRFAATLLVALLALASSAWAQDQAFTNRATELKEKGDAQSKTVASLPENTAVKVLGRGGAFTQVEANGQKGWVRAFHLRFPATIEKSGSGGGLASLTSMFGGSREQKQATIGTTGIRGLSPEDLKNAAPDSAALAKAQSYRADKPAAERFAREGKLTDVKVDYQEGGRR